MKQNPLAFQTLDSYLAAKELARRVHLAKITDPEPVSYTHLTLPTILRV